MPQSKLTEEQKQYIRDNYMEVEYTVLAKEIGMNLNTLYWWCAQNGLRKRRKGRKRDEKAPKSIIRIGIPKTYTKRPPAIYDNPSREQHVSRILNTKL